MLRAARCLVAWTCVIAQPTDDYVHVDRGIETESEYEAEFEVSGTCANPCQAGWRLEVPGQRVLVRKFH